MSSLIIYQIEQNRFSVTKYIWYAKNDINEIKDNDLG